MFAGSFAPAQETSNQAMLKEFTRSVKADGYVLSFVLLNDKTVDALFQAPGKFAMRARANQATTFYVQGMPEKDMVFDTKYIVQQDGKSISGSCMNIKHFDGSSVPKGTRMDGILQMEKKLDLTHPFTIKGAQATVEFKLTKEALGMLQN
jgi:hypothetical protein